MRLSVIILAIMMAICCHPSVVSAAVPPGSEIGQLDDLDVSDVQNFINHMDDEIKRVMPETDFKKMVTGVIRGELSLNPVEVTENCLRHLFKEVVANSALLGKLVVLTVICAVLQNLATAFEGNTTGRLTAMVTFLVLVSLALGSFALAVQSGREVVDNMVTFMQALLPLLLTLLVAVGGIASAAIFHPIILVSLTSIGMVIKNVILPLIFFAAVLDMVTLLSEKFQLSRLSGLMKTVALGTMGLLSTVFLGLLSIQGVAGAVGDSVVIRTAKFATDAFIPVVGGVLSEAMEAVVGSSLLVKNAVGIAGMLVIILTMAIPLLKIISLALIYKLAGALIQPVNSGQLSDCLNGLGNSLIALFGAVATVGLLFFFAVAIVVGLGNLTVMLR